MNLSNLSPDQIERMRYLIGKREAEKQRQARQEEEERRNAGRVAPIIQPANLIVPTSTNPPTPAVGIVNPKDYIILEGRTHGKYSYEDTLVAMNRTYQGKNWNDAHIACANENRYMLTIRQFVDFLNLLRTGKVHDGRGSLIKDKSKIEGILDEIYKVGGNWRSEWLDADFKVQNEKVVMNYEHRMKNGVLTPNRSNEVLEGYLAQNKQPGISLDDWLARATYQGLPPANVKNGELYYWQPGKDNNSVAGFCAGSVRASLSCGGYPACADASLGVRFARAKK